MKGLVARDFHTLQDRPGLVVPSGSLMTGSGDPSADGNRALGYDAAPSWVDLDLAGADPNAARLYICPACEKKRGVNISYGYPTDELFAEAERNEAVIGGCMQAIGEQPDRQCLDCRHQWNIRRRGANKSKTRTIFERLADNLGDRCPSIPIHDPTTAA